MRIKSAIIFIIVFILFSGCSKSDEIEFALYGEENLVIDFGNKYIDEGAYLKLNGENKDDEIKVISDLDTDILGEHTINYIYKDTTITRYIQVCDTSPPVIKLDTDSTIYVKKDSEFIIPEYSAIDNYDGDVSSLVEITSNVDTSIEGEYCIQYSVEDSSGNTADITQKIIVETSVLTESTQEFRLTGMYPGTILEERILDDDELSEYLDETIFIGDSISCYFIWYDLIDSAHGWGAQSLTPINISKLKIDKFFTKEQDLAINLIRNFQPKRIILTMGIDCVSSHDPAVIVNLYRVFLEEVMLASPDTQIIVNNILPVNGYIDTQISETFFPDNDKINKVNYYLVQMCSEIGVKYLNSAIVLKDEMGYGKSEYYLDDNYHLTEEGQTLVFEYITKHPYVN